MKKLLIFVDWFLPGYKAGGQIQSCANLAYALKDSVETFVVTSDRDMGDGQPYANVKIDEWILIEPNLSVKYLSPQNRGFQAIKSIILAVDPNCIYLNSMFSLSFTLLPLEACRWNSSKMRVVLAPRGMLHAGALQYKRIKKKIFFRIFKLRGFQNKVIFHATDTTEQTDIKRTFGRKVEIAAVKDFPSVRQDTLEIINKAKGCLTCLFISRISPKKNLLFLLSALCEIKSVVNLTIVGPVEDEKYWAKCMSLIETMPTNVKVQYTGPLPNHQLPEVYRRHHLFFLPTHGENFGHVIFDAFANGRPVLISDHTPWKGLKNKGIGWDFSLIKKDLFVGAIEEAAGWDQREFDKYCKNSWRFANKYIHQSDLKREYLRLFD